MDSLTLPAISSHSVRSSKPKLTLPNISDRTGNAPRTTGCILPRKHIPPCNTQHPFYAGLTPIGTIERVPTCSHRVNPNRIPKTTSYSLRREPADDTIKIDPLLLTSVYLDHSDRSASSTKLQASELSRSILSIHENIELSLMSLPLIPPFINITTFDFFLSIYENNQNYYASNLSQFTDSELIDRLTRLEHWFLAVIEPVPQKSSELKEWRIREHNKRYNCRTAYCDPNLYDYIQPLSVPLRKHLEIKSEEHGIPL